MKLIIDIPADEAQHIYNIANSGKDLPVGVFADLIRIVANGTPIPYNATVCDIERIIAKIKNIKDMEVVNGGIYVREYDVIQIIDKYTKGERE